MTTKIGHFEILSELARSSTGAVYKANDTETEQIVALKAIQLSAFGDSAQALGQALLQEVEAAKVLSSPNITPLLGAGEFDGQFCAAMEYVQGNSIATMLARKEGFSIWDLLDIGRQLCAGFDHASSKKVVHYSLEPSKIMCGWDGTVKILSFGVSSVGIFAHHVSTGLPTILHYTSPEQVQGQRLDGRSNLFSLGAMFYEMVTERKAFERDDIEGLRQSIVESTPVPPIQLNGKVHPLLSDLIMKALARDPAQRFQTGREMLDELEKCKESKGLAAKKADAPKGTMAPSQANAAAQAKFIAPAGAKTSASVAAKPAPPVPPKPAAPVSSDLIKPGLAKPSGLAAPASRPAQAKSTLAQPRLAISKTAAAAAGAGSDTAVSASSSPDSIAEFDLSDSLSSTGVKATPHALEAPSAHMSSAVVEPEVETFEPQAPAVPKIAVDPMMAESGPASSGTSFSDVSELPPLKEDYVAPPPPPPAPAYQPVAQERPKATMFDGSLPGKGKGDDKPKVQPREVAEKAIKEIKSVPPKLMGYALGAAGVLILLIAIGVTIYIHNQNDDDSGAARPAAAAQAAAPEVSQSDSKPEAKQEPVPTPSDAQSTETAEPEAAAAPVESTKAHSARKKAPAEPVIIPGQLTVDSTPQGAQVQIDGRSDASWVTPLSLNNLQPGQHSITVSKAGYTADSRTVGVTSGNRTTSVVHLSQLTATLIVKSDPPGANIYVDGRNVGTKTPAQVSVDKGQHVVLVRMMGYLDETMNGQFVLGQTFNFSPTLRPLGNADSIRTVGKMPKFFGGKGAQAGQATLSIRTQPKGAQVAINEHLMEKNSPLDVALDPGNYVIDITLTGYAPIHKVVTADKGGKVVVDDVMQRQ